MRLPWYGREVLHTDTVLFPAELDPRNHIKINQNFANLYALFSEKTDPSFSSNMWDIFKWNKGSMKSYLQEQFPNCCFPTLTQPSTSITLTETHKNVHTNPWEITIKIKIKTTKQTQQSELLYMRVFFRTVPALTWLNQGKHLSKILGQQSRRQFTFLLSIIN